MCCHSPGVTSHDASDSQTFAVIGAAMEVHRHLGPGFLEAVYREAVRWELGDRHIPFQTEVHLPIQFKGRQLVTGYRADLVCYGQIIVELKALRHISTPEEAQVLNYLKARGCPGPCCSTSAPRVCNAAGSCGRSINQLPDTRTPRRERN
jgi:GxxExxY protein